MPTTFDPGFNNTTVLLSNGNLTGTYNSTAPASVTARSTTNHSSGKFYLEFTNNAVGTPSSGSIFGCGDSGVPASGAVGIGFDTNSCGLYGINGEVYYNGTLIIAGSSDLTFVANDVAGVAIDLGNNAIWFRNVTSGTHNWNASGSANPATNTGGVALTSIGAVYFMMGAYRASTQSTVNIGGTSYAGTPPAGFGNWDVAALLAGFDPVIPLFSRSRSFQSAATMRGDEGAQAPLINWLIDGWAVQPWQPPHPRPERSAAWMLGDIGIQAAYIPPAAALLPLLTGWAEDEG